MHECMSCAEARDIIYYLLFTHSGLLYSWLAESGVVALTSKRHQHIIFVQLPIVCVCVKNKSVMVEQAEVVKLNQ